MGSRTFATLVLASILCLFAISLSSSGVFAYAVPAPQNGRVKRMGIVPGPVKLKEKDEEREEKADSIDGLRTAVNTEDECQNKNINYLVSLKRTLSSKAQADILDFLIRKGADVKQVYDYRVYKGILFSMPTCKDIKSSAWKSSLSTLAGVNSVEEDQLVKTY